MKLRAFVPDLSKPLTKTIVAIVMACARFKWGVLCAAALLTLFFAHYAAAHFEIDTRTSNFISAKLPWRQDMMEMDKAFPDRANQILVVIDGKTPELAEAAAEQLTDRLKEKPDLFESVLRPDGGPFFNKDALLFPPAIEVRKTTEELAKAEPLLAALNSDPSLRGIANTIGSMAQMAKARTGDLDAFDQPMAKLAGAFDDLLAHRPVFFSWRSLFTGATPSPRELRKLIEVKPVLDRTGLQPGKIPADFIRKSARDLGLSSGQGVRVRLTGAVPLADEEYGAIEQGATVNRIGTALVVLVILWLALKSPRIVLSVALTVAAGLAATAAVGLKMVGAFNLLSLAFGVLFVGIGTDFAIQFSVRYRDERHREPSFGKALSRGGARVGRPLALAAAATAAGFYSFLPTDYVGISQLGLIAGTGMFIAFFAAITLLPALLALFGAPAENQPIGFEFLAPADRFMARHRYGIVIGTLVIALAAAPLLLKLQFDFNPLNLSPPKAEAVAAMRDLMNDPQTDPNSMSILAPSLEEAQQIAERLRQLPQVASVTTLENFIPADQRAKLFIIHRAARALKPALDPRRRLPAPDDAADVAAMEDTVNILIDAAGDEPGNGAEDARRLVRALSDLVNAPPQMREAARKALLPSLNTTLDLIRDSLGARSVTLGTLPQQFKRNWETSGGRVRIDVAPAGNLDDNANLVTFAKEVRKVAPHAVGQPLLIQEGGKTVLRAFIQAGLWALLAISVLLLIVLRRVSDVLLTLVPLLLAALVTLEITALIGLPLNFANIMALPLLLGLGVAFKIYYIMAWRAGTTNLLETSLTRAVFFSALTTATAFGSLWLSNFPGLSSMGQLMALSLACTLAAAVLFQPALMGPPRRVVPEEGA